MDDSFSTVVKCIKQKDGIEFLTHENETPIEIHHWLLVFYAEDTVDISMMCCWVRKSMASGRNLDLNDPHILEDQSVQFMIWTSKMTTNSLKKINKLLKQS